MVYVKKIVRQTGQTFKNMDEFNQAAAAEPPVEFNAANDSSLQDYLTSWGLAMYIDKFKEHSVDVDILQILSAEDLKELVPVIGHRAKLTSQIAMLKNIVTDAFSVNNTFRRSVKDVLKPEHDDHFLLRWLAARQWDPVAAEKMLRDSMTWRDKWGVDTTLATWQPPEVLQKYFPSGSTGFDKEGSPVIIVPFVGLDAWGVLHSITRTELIKEIIRHLENYLAIGRKQAETRGPAALKMTVLFDMEGFHIRQYAWKPAAEMVFSLLQIYEANYPEILKSCFIINAPKMFSLAFSIVKKFMNELTLSKIKIFGSDPKKWQPALFELVDKDQLPKYYGGTLVDDNGDPKCSLIVKPGGKVPKSYFKRKTNESDKDYTRVTVKTGDKHSFELLCADNESILKWEVGVDSHDIKFLINRRDPEGNETLVHGPKKLSNGATDIGVLPVNGPATYSLVFDNKNSYLRSKKVFYDVLIAVPERDLDINNLPEDESTTPAAGTVH